MIRYTVKNPKRLHIGTTSNRIFDHKTKLIQANLLNIFHSIHLQWDISCGIACYRIIF